MATAANVCDVHLRRAVAARSGELVASPMSLNSGCMSGRDLCRGSIACIAAQSAIFAHQLWITLSMFIIGVIGVDGASRACLAVLNTRGADGSSQSCVTPSSSRTCAAVDSGARSLEKLDFGLWFANIVSCFPRLCNLRPHARALAHPCQSVCCGSVNFSTSPDSYAQYVEKVLDNSLT